MVILKLSEIYDILREFAENETLIKDNIEFENGDILEIVRD